MENPAANSTSMLLWDGKISSNSSTTPDQIIDIPSLVDMMPN